MIDYETFCKIKYYHEKELLNISQIAEKCALSRRTIAHWIATPKYCERANNEPRRSILDPYKDQLIQLVEKHDYSTQQLLQKIRENNYQGGYTILKEYLKKIRPRKATAYLTLNFAAGECAQVDWGSYGSVSVGSAKRKLHFFVMVLCYSRMMYVEFTTLQTMEHFLECHQNAFQYFGGMPSRIMIDNLRTGVLVHLLGEVPIFNQRYLDFARHHGFEISACAPRKGNEKGRVENGVGYVKKNFLNGLTISDFSVINPAAKLWLEQIANIRIHGETKKRPIDLFEEEKPRLLSSYRPLSYDTGVSCTVRASSRFRVTLDTNRYSVPSKYAGAKLLMKKYPDRLCIYAEDQLIARHPRSYDKQRDFENPDHVKELLEQRKQANNQKILVEFFEISEKAGLYFQQLSQTTLNAQHHLRKIVELSRIYGKPAVAAAIKLALENSAYSSSYILNILEYRSTLQPEPPTLHLTRNQSALEICIPEPDLSKYEQPEQSAQIDRISVNLKTKKEN